MPKFYDPQGNDLDISTDEANKRFLEGTAKVKKSDVVAITRVDPEDGKETFAVVPGNEVGAAVRDGWKITRDEVYADHAARAKLDEKGIPGPVQRLGAAISQVPFVHPVARGLARGLDSLTGGDNAEEDVNLYHEAYSAPFGPEVKLPFMERAPLIPNIGPTGGMVGFGGAVGQGVKAAAKGVAGKALARALAGRGASEVMQRALAAGAGVAAEGAGLAAEGAVMGPTFQASEEAGHLAAGGEEAEAVYKNPKAAAERVVVATIPGVIGNLALGGAAEATLGGLGAAGRKFLGGRTTTGLSPEARAAVLTGYMDAELAEKHNAAVERAELSHDRGGRLKKYVDLYHEESPAGEVARQQIVNPDLTRDKFTSEAKAHLDAALGTDLTEMRRGGYGAGKDANVYKHVEGGDATKAYETGMLALDDAAAYAQGRLAEPLLNAPTDLAARMAGAAEETRERIRAAIPKPYKVVFEPPQEVSMWDYKTPDEWQALKQAEIEGAANFPENGADAMMKAEEEATAWAATENLARRKAHFDAAVDFFEDKAAQRKLTGDIFNILDEYKQKVNEGLHKGVDPTSAYTLGKEFNARLIPALESTEAFGRMGELQKGMNAAMGRFIDARRAVSRYLDDTGTTARDKRFGEYAGSIDRVRNMLRDAARMEGESGAVPEAMKAARELADATRQLATELEPFTGKSAEAEKVVAATEKFAGTVERSFRFERDLAEHKIAGTQASSVRNLGTRILPGAKSGAVEGAIVGSHRAGLLGGAVGLFAGGSIGAALESLTNAATKTTRMAQFEAIGRYVDGKAKGAVGKFIARQFSPSARGRQGRIKSWSRTGREAVLEAAGKAAMNAVRPALRVETMITNDRLRRQFIGAMDLVTKASANAHSAENEFHDRTDGATADHPEVGAAAGEVTRNVIGFLMGKMPHVAPPDPFTGAMSPDAGVTQRDAEKFLRFVHAALDPLGTLDDLADGEMSPEAAETLRECYPDIFEQVKADILGDVAKAKKPMPYAGRVLVSTLFDVPAARTMAPEFVSRMQGAYMTDDQPDPNDTGMGDGRGMPRQSRASSKLGAQSMTQTQTLAANAQMPG